MSSYNGPASINWLPPIMWQELAERHFAFWTAENIQSVWAGTSFFIPGESNELSYSLAEVFLKLLSERGNASGLRAFLEAAQQTDAGQAAAMDALGTGLSKIAEMFLGPGEWAPNRKMMITCWKEAGWER